MCQHMYKHAQTRVWHREAGGQLFSSTPHESIVVVSVVTGPMQRTPVRGIVLYLIYLLQPVIDILNLIWENMLSVCGILILKPNHYHRLRITILLGSILKLLMA